MPYDGAMFKGDLASGPRGAVRGMDSITQADAAEDAGAIVVCGSHGGRSSGEFALAVPLALVVFNDAGIGRDDAGIAALAMLDAQGRAAATVSHDSARIGDAQDAWAQGRLSRVNAAAWALGLREGAALAGALLRLVGAVPSD
ncbi:MAG: hypothetical protein ACKVQR_08435 [Aquabacterium sp.]